MVCKAGSLRVAAVGVEGAGRSAGCCASVQVGAKTIRLTSASQIRRTFLD
jgi:hypothetical protein